jgi:hypothetical protein
MHHVLKSLRSLSPGAADRLMAALDLNVPSLVYSSQSTDETRIRIVPVLRNRIGPGTDASLSVFRGFMPFAENRVRSLIDPVVARLAPDLVIPREFHANDIVLLDQNPELRENPDGAGRWVVHDGYGLRVRYLRMGGTRLYIANEATLNAPRNWQQISLQGRNIGEIIKAKIVWIGRDIGERNG